MPIRTDARADTEFKRLVLEGMVHLIFGAAWDDRPTGEYEAYMEGMADRINTYLSTLSPPTDHEPEETENEKG